MTEFDDIDGIFLTPFEKYELVTWFIQLQKEQEDNGASDTSSIT